MYIIGCYFLIFIGIGVFQYKKSRTMDSFSVGNRSLSATSVSLSIAASCVGGSATIGAVSLAWSKGFPSIWYLGSGAAGLVVLTFFLARQVRATGVRTLPEMVEIFIGPQARRISAVIIIIAWTAILAAQFSASARIIASLGDLGFQHALWLGGGLIIAYTALGGQLSVIKTDKWQFFFMILILACVVVSLVGQDPRAAARIRWELFTPEFSFSTWSYYMLIIGGSYVVCPMLFSRILSARDEKSAFRASLGAVPFLLIIAVLIVYIGLLSKGILPTDTAPDTVLTQGIMTLLPSWLGTALLIALLSAVISSADSCLITASTVMGNDLFKVDSASLCRGLTVIIGLGALFLSLRGGGILTFLFAANDVYVCGIVAPVFVSMIFRGDRKPSSPLMLTGMIVGGGFGITAAISGVKFFSYVGLGASVLFSVLSLGYGLILKENSG